MWRPGPGQEPRMATILLLFPAVGFRAGFGPKVEMYDQRFPTAGFGSSHPSSLESSDRK